MKIRLPAATSVGMRGAWRLKNALFKSNIAPLNASPREKAASALATIGVWSGVNSPRW